MAYELPALTYAQDALEPHMDAQTVGIHHDKHHQAYLTNLNKALEGLPEWAGKPIEEVLRNVSKIPADKRQPVINHGGGYYHHNLLWITMAPHKGGEPGGALAAAINSAFGGFAAFKEQMSNAGMTQFGSGWAWLCVDDASKALILTKTSNQDSPLSLGKTPILPLDVWEHAYYLKYQNRRADYIQAWWNLVNWDKVAELYAAAKA